MLFNNITNTYITTYALNVIDQQTELMANDSIYYDKRFSSHNNEKYKNINSSNLGLFVSGVKNDCTLMFCSIASL